MNFNKRRGINSEIKTFKEQKVEAERFGSLRDDRDALTVEHLLWKLYHIEDGMTAAGAEIVYKGKDLVALRQESAALEDGLKDIRKEAARAQKEVIKEEKKVKAKEREADDQVSVAGSGDLGFVQLTDRFTIASCCRSPLGEDNPLNQEGRECISNREEGRR